MTFATQLSTAFSPLADNYDSGYVSAGLSWAQSFIEGYCNTTFDSVTGATVFCDPYFGSALLPFVPVQSVSLVQGWLPDTSAQGGMNWVTLTNYQVNNDTGLIYDTSSLPGFVWSVGPSWPWLPESLQVTYSYGYAEIPQALVDVGVRLCLQYLNNPASLLLKRVGDIEYRYAGSAGPVLNEFDRRILDRYSVVSVA